ncbi:MAG: hypothetical protein C4318_01795 [Acidimicrobiia bacterium]
MAQAPSRALLTLEDDSGVVAYEHSGEGVVAGLGVSGEEKFPKRSLGEVSSPPVLAWSPQGKLVAGASTPSGIRVFLLSSQSGLIEGTPLPVDTQGGQVFLAADTSSLYVTYTKAFPTSGVYISKSRDGLTWSSPRLVTPASLEARSAVASAASGVFVAVADARKLSFLKEMPGGGFALAEETTRLSSNTFSFGGDPPRATYAKNNGIYLASLGPAGVEEIRLGKKEEKDSILVLPASSSESLSFVFSASPSSMLRYKITKHGAEGPLIVADRRAASLQAAERGGPAKTWLSWMETSPGGSSLYLHPEDLGPPWARWLAPRERSVVAGTIALRVAARDETGLSSPPRFFVAEESGPPEDRGEPITCLRGRPGFVPVPPGEKPSPIDRRECKQKKKSTPTYANKPQPKPPGISGPQEEIEFVETFDTRQVADGWYRFGAFLEDTSANETFAVLDPYVDNSPPEVSIDLPLTDTLVSSTADVIGTVTDATLSAWTLHASIPGQPPRLLSSGPAPVLGGSLGTYKTTYAPAGYAGPVYLVLSATDSAEPVANTASYTRRIYSDDPRDAYGFLGLAFSYELSTTVAVTADISGAVSSWVLEAYKKGEATPSLTPPSFSAQGSTAGPSTHLADWDIKNRWGPGEVSFILSTYDQEGDRFEDRKDVSFYWTPARLAITAPSLDGPLSGTISIEGYIEGSNIWAWALGTPVSDSAPSFSPDDGLVVFESTRELGFSGPLSGWVPSSKDIWVVGSDGTGLRRLTGGPESLAFGYNSTPSFSPDGAWILFSSTRDGNQEIYKMSSEGGGLTNLSSNPAQDLYPAWSPDGRSIAFVSTREGTEALYLMGADGSGPLKLLEMGGGIRSPDFSPDGKRIVFEAGTPGSQQIYQVYLTDTQNPILLTDPSRADSYSDPAFSPDGRRIAYVRHPDPDIYVMSADGTGETPYVSSPAADVDPDFSSDGSKLVFASDRSRSTELYVKDAGDPQSPEVLLIQDPASPHQDRLPSFSPQRFPFPPAPTENLAPKIDPAPFQEGSYLLDPPEQFPQGPRSQGTLGQIDTRLLRPGVTPLVLVVLQCPSPPPPFVLRIPRSYDQETSTTISTLASCRAYQARQSIRVQAATASVQVRLELKETGPGFAGPLSAGVVYRGRGAWQAEDRWYIQDDPQDLTPGPVPELVRTKGRMWAKGSLALYPRVPLDYYVPVGDYLALESVSTLMSQPRKGLFNLSGSPPQEIGEEEFAPGRRGIRLQAPMPQGSSHFGGTPLLVAWEEPGSGLLGCLSYDYQLSRAGPYAPLPDLSSGWEGPQGTTVYARVTLVFSNYNGDAFVPRVQEAGE